MADNEVSVFAVGDIIANRPDDYQDRWGHLVPVFKDADISYANVEQLLADQGQAHDPYSLNWRFDPRNAEIYKFLGIDVGSVVGNHIMEWTPEAMLQTNEVLRDLGVKTFGSGKNIGEARAPAVVESKGVKVAFLAYNTIIGFAEEALTGWPGVAPLRADTFYQQIEHNQPAGPARVRSFVDKEDLEEMMKDVRKAKEENDVVIVTPHWGIHYQRATMAEYQYEAAHAMIDAGADVVLGSHPHMLKAVEVYKGKVICHSIGEFQIDGLVRVENQAERFGISRKTVALREFALHRPYDPEHPNQGGRPDDVAYTGVFKVRIDPATKTVSRVGFMPMMKNADRQGAVQQCYPGTPEFDRVTNYLKSVTEKGGCPETEFKIDGEEMVVLT